MEKQEQDTKKITMLRKIGYLFDRKQKIQFVGLGILIPVSYTHLTLPTIVGV